MAFGSILDLWNKWNIRGFVILSLSLQVFLILFASLRKKVTNQCIIFLLRLAYLTADWVAAFTIGLISQNQGNSSTRATEVDKALQAFWASFLLLHLGGPDTITAFSLEGNSLWERHLLSLFFQVGTAIYLLVQIFSNDKLLVIPMILVFLVGIIKNTERTLALNLSSLSRLRELMHPSFSSEESYQLDYVPEDEYIDEEDAKFAESKVVKHAYHFFQIFKVFVVDLIFTNEQREESLRYFNKVSPVNALRVISVELQFMYEMLHTKALAIRSKWSYIFRFIALNVLVVAFILFNRLNKHRLSKLDIKITHSLLFGGIALDVIALFMLVFSDWTIAKIKPHSRTSSKLDSFLHKFVSATDYLRKARFATCVVEPNTNYTYEILDTPLIFRRWSESISACNLFSELCEESPRNLYKCHRGGGIIAFFFICSFPFRMARKIFSPFYQSSETNVETCCPRNTSFIFRRKHVTKNPFIKKLWIFIFEEVRHKSKNVDQTMVKKIFEARGDMFLRGRLDGINCSNLLKYVIRANYDSTILCWHIATEVWYNIEKFSRNEEREFSKILSDYMLYLLANQPNVMFAVAGNAKITLQETLEMLRFITRNAQDVMGHCMHFVENPPAFLLYEPNSESPFVQGLKLAREMEHLEEKKWEVMRGVWVEMLTYAATHIRGETHVQVLSKGGELLAFVWLLMAHFGCFYKPPWGMYYDAYQLGESINV
ncbi:hypothetical protein BT93_E1446 [Corymbia citriodora subsp. variegata]|nr:hypothetical protein BT93_E1446 [Corymbia citriodora subsp. variegata]